MREEELALDVKIFVVEMSSLLRTTKRAYESIDNYVAEPPKRRRWSLKMDIKVFSDDFFELEIDLGNLPPVEDVPVSDDKFLVPYFVD